MPVWVLGMDKSLFVSARACFDLLLALDGGVNVREGLAVDEAMKSVLRGEGAACSGTVFAEAARKVIGHAGVYDPARGAGEHVHPVAVFAHGRRVSEVECWTKRKQRVASSLRSSQ